MRPTSTAATGSGSATRTSARASSSSASGATGSARTAPSPAPVDADLLHVHKARARLIGAFLVAVLVADEEDRSRLDAVALGQLQHALGVRLDAADVLAAHDVRDEVGDPVVV